MIKIITNFIIKLALIAFLIVIILQNSIIFISKIFLINNRKAIMKNILLSKIFKKNKRNINNINTLFIKDKIRFGNYFISVNNAIIYCEFLGCKKIILEYNRNIYINNTTFYKNKNINITIETNQTFNSSDNNAVSLNANYTFFKGFKYLRKINRLIIFKKQFP